MAGINRAQLIKVEKDLEQAGERKEQRPCVFLVHISVVREAAVAIGDYITLRGEMDIYLDLNDVRLTGMTAGGLDNLDRYLAEGFAQSTHVMGLVSPETPDPWWNTRVLELGRASGMELAILALKGITEEPASYGSFEVLRGIKSLNEYLFRVSPTVDRIIFNNPAYGGLMAHTAPHHPLDAFLDWEK
jgi:hypothetical protein